MRQNRQVCFEVEDIPDLGNWKSVICWGEYEELPNRTERHPALDFSTTGNCRRLPVQQRNFHQPGPSDPTISTCKRGGIPDSDRKKTGKFEKQEELRSIPGNNLFHSNVISKKYMKTILAPTDFSASSLNAVNYAADLAVSINAKLVLFHAIPFPIAISEISVPGDFVDDLMDVGQEDMDDLVTEITIPHQG